MIANEAPFTTVLLPGLACDAEMWRAQLPALAPRFAPRVSTARADTDALRAVRLQEIEMVEAGEGDEVLEADVWFVFDRSAWDDQPLLDRYLAMVRRARWRTGSARDRLPDPGGVRRGRWRHAAGMLA